MPTFLQGIAKKAQEQPKHRFGNLYELLNEAYLKECWRDIRKDAAYGVDRVSAQDYEEDWCSPEKVDWRVSEIRFVV